MKYLAIGLLSLILLACGGKSWETNLVDQLLERYKNSPNTEILLADMQETNDGKYIHAYKVIGMDGNGGFRDLGTVQDNNVTEGFYALHYDNLGMSIGRIDSLGQKSTLVAPPGFNTVIGNPKYGEFREENGHRVWHFFSSYLFYRTLFGLGTRAIYYDNYHNYYRHYRYSRPYYGYGGRGTSGTPAWGTKSKATQTTHKTFYQRSINRTGSWNKSYTSRSSRGGGGFGK